MIVCYFGTYRKNYSRNKIMIASLRSVGIEVKECHATLWHGTEDRVKVTKGGWKNPKFWTRALKAYLSLLREYRQIGHYDIMLVGYPGHYDVFLAKVLTSISHKPLVWDIFMSIYLIAIERELDLKNKFTIQMLHLAESLALRQPDLLIQDTSEYVNWFHREYGISPDRFRLVPTGADDKLFRTDRYLANSNDENYHVLYYGSFIPNHGVKIIVEAAKHLQNRKDIIFEFIGDGPERSGVADFVKNEGLKNVIFHDWMEQAKLLNFIAGADVCLGAFGNTPQSLMTIQNKIYECMAMQKPVLTGDSPAIQQAFIHKTHLYVTNRNPIDLSNAILELKNNPELCTHLAKQAYQYYLENVQITLQGKKLSSYLSELIVGSQ